MSLFQITNQNVSSNLKASWFTGNSRSNLKIAYSPQPKATQICTNFFNNNGDICDIRKPNDRFSAYGLIKSSDLNSVSNQSIQQDSFSKIIRITKDTLAHRSNFFDEHTGKFVIFPQNSSYNLPKQNISTIFTIGQTKYVNNTIFLIDNYKLFEREIIQLNNSYTNVELSTTSDQNVYSIECENSVDCDGCCWGISGNFFQPTDDLDNVYDSTTLGISWEDFNFSVSDEEPASILDIYKNEELIISILYSHYYNNREITLKHPIINSVKVILNPSTNNLFL
jgi:hypothetical protein